MKPRRIPPSSIRSTSSTASCSPLRTPALSKRRGCSRSSCLTASRRGSRPATRTSASCCPTGGSAARRPRSARTPRGAPRIAGGIVMMDPPELTRIRNLVTQAFTNRRVEQLRPHRPRPRQRADRQDGAPAAPLRISCGTTALPIPMSVICELLGVPGGGSVQVQGVERLPALDQHADSGADAAEPSANYPSTSWG